MDVCAHVCQNDGKRESVCYLPTAAPKNNCPESSFCLVIVCSYLPSCRTEKKWLSNIMLSLTAQAWISSNKWSLAFGPIAVFIKSNFLWLFFPLYLVRCIKESQASGKPQKGQKAWRFYWTSSSCKYGNYTSLTLYTPPNFPALVIISALFEWRIEAVFHFEYSIMTTLSFHHSSLIGALLVYEWLTAYQAHFEAELQQSVTAVWTSEERVLG